MKITRIFLVLFSVSVNAETITLAPEAIVSVYDGDTFFINIESWPPIIGKRIGIRVAGIDTPAIGGKCPQEKKLALKAKQHTKALLDQGKIIELRDIERGKYFRIVADVYVDDRGLTESLIKAGLGYSYTGGKKQSFCNVLEKKDQP